jgi:hypothetical protein
MKILATCIIATSLLVPTAAVAQEITSQDLVGHFKTLDREVPGCGVLSIGSKATFVIDDSHKEVLLVIPCIEMQTVKAPPDHATNIELGTTYRILASSARPRHLDFPTASPGLLYLIEIQESD